MLLALLLGLAQASPATGPALELPVGPVASALGPVALPSTLEPDAAFAPLGWDGTGSQSPWRTWREAIESLRRNATNDATSAWWTLARCARDQGRGVDAWRYTALGWTDEPARRAERDRLCASLVLGIGMQRGVGSPLIPEPGPALPNGVALAPGLPPPAGPGPDGQLPRKRELFLTGLRVGTAVLDLRVSAESDGLQVDLDHTSGGACDLLLALADPGPDLSYRARHLDWRRVESDERFLELHIDPGDDTHTLWGRYRGAVPDWPVNLPDQLSQAVRRSGLQVRGVPSENAERFVGFGQALARLLDVPFHAPAGAALDGLQVPGLILQFDAESSGTRKLFALCGLAETFLLQPDL